MLPDFDDNGNLPPGIHQATIEEVAARFGAGSQERRIETRELVDFVAWAKAAHIARLVINGSYVTNERASNDVDLVILPSLETLDDPSFGQFGEQFWPFLHVFVAADSDDFEQWANVDFATDKEEQAKGVVEINL